MQLKFQSVNDYGKECKTERRCEFMHVVTEDLWDENNDFLQGVNWFC